MKHIHLIGIGGTGLSAIARVLIENGYSVSGSDREISLLAADIARLGAKICKGHDAKNIAGADVIIYSSAIPEDNPEIIAAREANIPLYKRSEFIGQLMVDKSCIAIAGTHGKTTTTAMIAWLLTALGQDPSYIIGGVARNMGNNAHAGNGNTFVIEADEYDRMFLGLQPDYMVITNMEHDHPDCYPSVNDYHQAFISFIKRLKADGIMFVCKDDKVSFEIVNETLPCVCRCFTYGLDNEANYYATNLHINSEGCFSFDLISNLSTNTKTILKDVDLSVPGKHNVQNAVVALAIVHQLGLPMADAGNYLKAFLGAGRRFEKLGEVNDTVIIDDYGHHPTEIEATLSAARSCYPGRRIWAVWQPHTYSRTQSLTDRFIASLSLADKVIITEVYAAREKNNEFTSNDIVKKIASPDVVYAAHLKDAETYLLQNLQPNDVLIVLSAGDANQISANVLKELQD